MVHKGRTSAAAANVVALRPNRDRPVLKPLQPLTTAEKKVFDLVMQEHRFLSRLDIPLVMAFSRATDAISKAKTPADIEKLSRTALAIARALRLTPINRTHPEKLGRYMANKQNLSYYERQALGEDDDE